MATSSPNLREITATTIKHYSRTMADNVSKGNALYSRLASKGMVRMIDGGETILQELMYAENASFSWYAGYDKLDVSVNDTISAAEYAWKQCAVNVTYNGLETRIKNAGRQKIHDLLESRIKVAEITMRNKMSVSLYSDGTANSGKEITGLAAQVAIAPTTGIVGGINRANFTFWRNNTSGDVAEIDTSAATLNSEMQDMWMECSRGSDKVDLIVADQVLYKRFWAGLQDIQRITQSNEAVKGYASLKFNTADVVFENSTGQWDSGIADNRMFFLNTDYIFLKVHAETNMVPLEEVNAINQDASVLPIVWAGNLTQSAPALQGIIYT